MATAESSITFFLLNFRQLRLPSLFICCGLLPLSSAELWRGARLIYCRLFSELSYFAHVKNSTLNQKDWSLFRSWCWQTQDEVTALWSSSRPENHRALRDGPVRLPLADWGRIRKHPPCVYFPLPWSYILSRLVQRAMSDIPLTYCVSQETKTITGGSNYMLYWLIRC